MWLRARPRASPCSTPTAGSAPGATLRHDSVVGSAFTATVAEEVVVAGHDATVVEVTGTAHNTGEHRFALDPDDPLGAGFVLR